MNHHSPVFMEMMSPGTRYGSPGGGGGGPMSLFHHQLAQHHHHFLALQQHHHQQQHHHHHHQQHRLKDWSNNEPKDLSMPPPPINPPLPPPLPPPSSVNRGGSSPDSNKKRRKPKMTEMKCHVCGDKAPDHIHYGGIACFSCRAFFRRSVPKHNTYFCSTDQSCQITVATRKNCQFCRYKKCLNAGMKPSWVLSEEEKTSRNLIKFVKKNKINNNNVKDSTSSFPPPPNNPSHPPHSESHQHHNNNSVLTDRIGTASHFQSSSGPSSTSSLSSSSSSSSSSSASSSPGPLSPGSPSICFTTEESRHIDNLIFAQDSTRHFIPMPESVMKEILEMTRDPTKNMSVEGITEIYRVVYSRVAKFATYVSQFEDLMPEDKKLLLSKNMDSMATLRSVVCFNKDGTGNLSAQLKNTGSPVYGTVGPHYIGVERVFRHPWAKSEDHRLQFIDTFQRLASLGLGEKAAMLLQLVTLFSVMELPVTERTKIERYQEQMALLLYRFLKSQNCLPTSADILKHFVLLSELRDLSNMLTDQSDLS